MKLTADEHKLLKACRDCEKGKGVPVGREWRKVAKSLTRKGLAWTMESVFMVCIITEAGRAALSDEVTR